MYFFHYLFIYNIDNNFQFINYFYSIIKLYFIYKDFYINQLSNLSLMESKNFVVRVLKTLFIKE